MAVSGLSLVDVELRLRAEHVALGSNQGVSSTLTAYIAEPSTYFTLILNHLKLQFHLLILFHHIFDLLVGESNGFQSLVFLFQSI